MQIPELHKKGVTCISGIMVSETEAVFASTSSDGTVYLWEVVFPSTGEGEPKSSLNTYKLFCFIYLIDFFVNTFIYLIDLPLVIISCTQLLS